MSLANSQICKWQDNSIQCGPKPPVRCETVSEGILYQNFGTGQEQMTKFALLSQIVYGISVGFSKKPILQLFPIHRRYSFLCDELYKLAIQY